MAVKIPVWKGKPLKTYGDICDAMQGCQSKEEAKEFMKVMRANDAHADEGIGYMTGYFSAETATRMRDWFGVTHPVFGDKQPTFEEAFQKGLEMGRKAKRRAAQLNRKKKS